MELEELEEMEAAVKAACVRIRTDERFVRVTLQAIAEHRCPFAVGDYLVGPKEERATLASITYRSQAPGYTIAVRLFRKDNKPRMYTTHVYDASKYRKEETE